MTTIHRNRLALAALAVAIPVNLAFVTRPLPAGDKLAVGQLHAGAVEFAVQNSAVADGEPFTFRDFLDGQDLVAEYLVNKKGLDEAAIDLALDSLTMSYLEAGAFDAQGELKPFDEFADQLIDDANSRPDYPISGLMAEQLRIIVALTRDPQITANDFRQYMHQVFAKQDWRGDEKRIAELAVKVADSSLRVTRIAEGGLGDTDHRVNRGGGGTDPDPGTTLKKLCSKPWWKVAAADIVGCTACTPVGGAVGCVACGAVASYATCKSRDDD